MTATRLMYAVTAPISALIFLEGQLRATREAGFEVHVLCGSDPSGRLARRCADEGARLHEIDVTRTPSVRADARALAQVFAVLRSVQPDILVAGTPKMSLLALTAGKVLRLPSRIYLCHGLRFEGASGLRRSILARLELLLCVLAHHTVAVSPSVAEGLRRVGVASREVNVLGSGSPNGVDLEHFRPAPAPDRQTARTHLGLPPDGRVLTFVGRLTGDKGLPTLVALADSLDLAAEDNDDGRWLLVVGDAEPHGAEDVRALAALRANAHVILAGQREDMRLPYAATDVLVLPTKREGLPTVVIEAAAAGVPTVAYKVTGTVDAIRDGDTGFLLPPENVSAFVDTALSLVDDEDSRVALGRGARQHVQEAFSRETVWKQWTDFFQRVDGRRRTSSRGCPPTDL